MVLLTIDKRWKPRKCEKSPQTSRYVFQKMHMISNYFFKKMFQTAQLVFTVLDNINKGYSVIQLFLCLRIISVCPL